MIEPRIYRAAFVPAVFALILVMFSLESRPRPLAQGLPADVVFGSAGGHDHEGDRRRTGREAGSVGDRRAAGLVVGAFRSRGFTTQVDLFDHDGKRLMNVIGRRAGKSQREIVV